jgi:hypothetical protein
MSDALSNLKDHAPSLPSASDVRDAVQSHLPSVDMDAVKSKAKGKRSIAMVLGLLAGAAALFGLVRRRRNPQSSATVYTPPLPKP